MSMIERPYDQTSPRRSDGSDVVDGPPPGIDADPGLLHRAYAIDLEFERSVSRNRNLALFRRNASSWELLLALCCAPDHGKPGVYELIEGLSTKGLGQSALLRFVRDRRDDGLLVFDRHHTKKSKMQVRPEPELARAMSDLLLWRAVAIRDLLSGTG